MTRRRRAPGLVERAVRAYLPAASEGSPALTVELVLRVAGLAALVVIAAALVVTLVRTDARGRSGAA